MKKHHKIDYVEFPCCNFVATKAFFSQVFGWSFTDYGPDYTAFSGAGLDGGLYSAERCSTTATGAALVVFYSDDLEQTLAAIEAAGGTIAKQIFSFPGGRRFHFIEPGGNEFAVWSEA